MSIKNLFFKVDKPEEKTVDKQNPQSNIQVPPEVIAQYMESIKVQKPVEHVIDDESSKKYIKHFQDILESNQSKNLGYLDFEKSLQNLNAVQIPEDAKYKAAYAILSAQGLTKESLINDIENYNKLLVKDSNEFNDNYNNIITEKTADLNSKYSTLESENIELTFKIQEMTDKINANVIDMQKITSDINDTKSKLDDTYKNYNTIYNNFITNLNSILEKIKNYL